MKLKFLKKAEQPNPAARTAEALPATPKPATPKPATGGSRSMRTRTFFQGLSEAEAEKGDKELNAFLSTHNVLTLQFDRAGGKLICRVLYRV